jgi:ketosteroid isomerase-like protein
MYRSFFPQFSRIEQEAVSEEVEVLGDWAFAWGRESTVLVPHGDGAPIHMDGKGLSILKRQTDGSWKCARAINNSQVRATLQNAIS